MDIPQKLEQTAAPTDWQPNATAARTRLENRDRAEALRPRVWPRFALAGAVAGVLLTIAATGSAPSVRAFAGTGIGFHADQIWHVFTLAHMPKLLMLHPANVLALGDIKVDAVPARLAFTPRLPTADVVKSAPAVSLIGAQTWSAEINTGELQRAVAARHNDSETIPPNWNGARMTAHAGASHYAEWRNVRDESSGEIEWSALKLLQLQPGSVSATKGIDPKAFVALYLRAVARTSHEDAAHLAQSPLAWSIAFLRQQLNGPVVLREEALRSGPTQFLAHMDNGQVKGLSLLWATPDRLYILNGTLLNPCEYVSLGMAGALVNAIDIANSI